ncbi:uncharacterized protein A4U43_C04F32790 [Asparagus officinalis]|uniref:Uncharacterized protein n=1 Tax=Asparagus officinalis TaxID=4686 RepID=A0A5P1FAK9_ASPOF|nr:uncharacterized protein A4U43_C04F32790 [Asparagus officinalis]
MATVKDILTFHNQDLTLYNHILPLTQNPCDDVHPFPSGMSSSSSLSTSFPLSSAAACHNPTLLRHFIAEANSILDVLRPGSWAPLEARYTTLIPFTAELVEERLTLGFFYWNSGFVVRGIMGILDGVGRVLFDEELKGKFEGYRATVERGETPDMPPELAERYEVRRRRRMEVAEEHVCEWT